MRLQRLLPIAAGTLAAIVAVIPVPLAAQAQQIAPAPQSAPVPDGGMVHAGIATIATRSGGPVFFGGANNFEFISAGPALSGETVTGSPYSAEAVTETSQTLGDGNKISRTNSSKIYRDSQGRTRREQTISALGPWSSAGDPIEMVFINDPVAGVNYVLNTKEQTAQKAELHHIEADGKGDDMQVEKGNVHWQAKTDGGPAKMVFRSEHREVTGGEAGEARNLTVVHSAVNADFSVSDDNTKTESLGKQVIEGVEADGTRTTITIPAGQIGNERPIEIASESWYSPQLQTVVMSTQDDPRMGKTTYRLTNIQLVEPLPTMFEVPAGYTIQESPMEYFERKLPPPGDAQTAPAH